MRKSTRPECKISKTCKARAPIGIGLRARLYLFIYLYIDEIECDDVSTVYCCLGTVSSKCRVKLPKALDFFHVYASIHPPRMNAIPSAHGKQVKCKFKMSSFVVRRSCHHWYVFIEFIDTITIIFRTWFTFYCWNLWRCDWMMRQHPVPSAKLEIYANSGLEILVESICTQRLIRSVNESYRCSRNCADFIEYIVWIYIIHSWAYDSMGFIVIVLCAYDALNSFLMTAIKIKFCHSSSCHH